jgi:hypothetical protein
MEPAKNLIKNKIAETLFNCQVVKHYTKFLKNLQVEIKSVLNFCKLTFPCHPEDEVRRIYFLIF